MVNEAAGLPAAILFACNMNAVRSPMAAGLMNHYLGHQMTAVSVGVHSGEQVNGFACAAMAGFGIDLGGHEPRTFADIAEQNFDLIVSLTPEAHHQSIELTRSGSHDAEYWPTLDPTLATGNRDQIMAEFRTLRDALWRKIQRRFGTPSAPIV